MHKRIYLKEPMIECKTIMEVLRLEKEWELFKSRQHPNNEQLLTEISHKMKMDGL